jgi:hypothetical protein
MDPKLCPLCGKPNGCARVVDPENNDCWCSLERFPEALLESVPPESKRKACICRNCVQQAKK